MWVAVDQICAVYATRNELRVLDRMGTWHLASAGSLEEAKERAALLVRQVNKPIDTITYDV